MNALNNRPFFMILFPVLLLISAFTAIFLGILDGRGVFFSKEEVKYSNNIYSAGIGKHKISKIFPGDWIYVCEATNYLGDVREDIQKWSGIDISSKSIPLALCELDIIGGCEVGYTVFIGNNDVKILRYSKYYKKRVEQGVNGCWCYKTASVVLKPVPFGGETALEMRIEGINVGNVKSRRSACNHS